MKNGKVPYALGLPKALHDSMKKSAIANRRSLNAEIAVACERYLDKAPNAPNTPTKNG